MTAMALATIQHPMDVPANAPTLDLDHILDQFESLLAAMPMDVYNTRTSTQERTLADQIDALIRRSDAFLAGSAARVIVYDLDNLPRADVDPKADLRRIGRLRKATDALDDMAADEAVWVVEIGRVFGDVDRGWSTIGAEMALLVARLVEEQRRIAAKLRSAGISVPRDFGTMPIPPLRCRGTASPLAALSRLLDQLAELVRTIPPDVYTASIAPAVSGTIGQHVRHCLDHVAALVEAAPNRELSYDHRERGTAVETDPDVAAREIERLDRALAACCHRALDGAVTVSSVLSSAGELIAGASSFARELAFVINHTIHHQALMAVLLTWHGRAVPTGFGYAPSTPRPH